MKLKARGTYGLVVHLLVIALFTFTLSACPSGTDEKGGGGGGETGVITLAADPLTIPADGTSSTAIVALLETSTGGPVASGTKVTFTTTLGLFQNGKTTFEVRYTAPATGDEETEGAAEETQSFVGVSLISATTPGSAAVTAESNGVKQTIYVQFVGEGDEGLTDTILLTAAPLSIAADGKSTTTITATLLTSTADPVAKGTVVTFTTTLGVFPNGQVLYQLITTDEGGGLSVPLMAGLTAGTATVTVESDGVEQVVYIQFTDNRATAAISLTALPTSIPADGISSSSINAVLTATTGSPVVEGTIVIFTTTLGSFANGLATYQAATVGDGGKVVISLMSGLVSGAAIVTATSNGVNQSIYVQFTSDIDDRDTATITLAASPASIPADGTSSASITATLFDGTGDPVPKGTSVSFMTTLGTFPNGGTVYEASTGDATGVVVVSLTAGLTQNSKVVVSAQSNGVTQSVSLQFTGEEQPDTPTSISLGTTKTSVKSDDIDSATITATVLNSNNAVVKGANVAFSADGGAISSSSAVTDADGHALILFKSGTVDMTNKTVTIMAQVSGLQAQIPLKIVGSTLTLATSLTSIPDDGSTRAVLTITAKNAAGVEVYDTPLTMTVSGAGGAALAQFSADYPLDSSLAPVYSGRTDVLGQFKVYVSGTQAGAVTITAQGLGDTKDVAYTINAAASVIFGISALESPAGTPVTYQDPFPLPTNTDLKIIVDAPDAGETDVIFATTVGDFDAVTPGLQQVVTIPIGTGQAAAVLKSATAGLASVQVYYSSGDDPSDSMAVAISAPSSEAAQITVQSKAYIVAPSTGGVTNSVELTATVKNAGGQVVGDAPVAFSINNATGGGEYVSPVVVYTDSSGTALTTFYSGSLSTDSNGVRVIATVALSGPLIQDYVDIVIGGTAGSVTIGRGTVVESSYNETAYKLPMSVLVADSQGNPVSGAVVTLGAWPSSYRTGGWYDSDPDPEKRRFVPYISGSYNNEDINHNLVNDAGEDVNMDGYLTPPNSAAGSLPEPVTTDENGVANFDLYYLKANSVWIVDRITASTMVFGTETTSSIDFALPAERTEAEDGVLPDSSWAAWVADIPGVTALNYMPWFSGYGLDYFSAVYGYFTIIVDPVTGDVYTNNDYQYDISPLATPGTVFTDVVSVVDGLGRGIVVPFRVIVK